MDEKLIPFILTAFVTLIVVINPIAVSPVFVSVTKGMTREERRSVLNRAIFSSIMIAIFFLIAGRAFLSYLGVSMFAFTISGGILLFIIAYPMLFGQKKATPSAKDEKVVTSDEDVAFFPMT
ncbi:MAG TPA: MarC family protein, partial [Cytophagales bacterium]|nr:MarC family protein [Cytophagales bacterium]